MEKELRNMAGSPPPYDPPSYSKTPRPPPPSGYYQTPSARAPAYPPMSSYAPAPPVMQQQTSNNVVVVGSQPQTVPSPVVHVRAPYASTYLILTAVMMVLCFLHGNLPAFICLVPALICSCAASENNTAGEYDSARSCGSYSLCCNILSIVYYFLVVVAGVILVVIYFTKGLAFINSHNDVHINTCQSGCDWQTGVCTFCDDYEY